MSDDFLLLSRSVVREMLKRDELHVPETVVYNRLKQWSEHRLREGLVGLCFGATQLNDSCSDENAAVDDAQVREFLGDDLWLVRFAQMSPAEFANGPALDKCLTDKVRSSCLNTLITKEIVGKAGHLRLHHFRRHPRRSYQQGAAHLHSFATAEVSTDGT